MITTTTKKRLGFIIQGFTFVLLLALFGCEGKICYSKDLCRNYSEFDDPFSVHKLLLETDKIEYSVGERITLRAGITPHWSLLNNSTTHVRLFKNRKKSLILKLDMLKCRKEMNIRGMASIGPVTKKTSIYDSVHGEMKEIRRKNSEEFELIEITPNRPYKLIIRGRIYQESRGAIVVDFGEFGKFQRPCTGEFQVTAVWKAVDLHPMASDDGDLIITNFRIMSQKSEQTASEKSRLKSALRSSKQTVDFQGFQGDSAN